MKICSVFIFFLFIFQSIHCSEIEEEEEGITFENNRDGFLRFSQALEAYKLKKKFEVGRLAVHLIHQLSRERELNSVQIRAPFIPRGVDPEPERAHEVSAGFYRKYMEWGISGIVFQLLTAVFTGSGYVADNLLYMAIRNENVKLVNDLLNTPGLIYKTYDMYKFAVRNLQEENTATCELLVELFAGSDVGTVPNMRNKLNWGFALRTIHTYIAENEFPMLRRALDEGLDPNLDFSTHGSLLNVSLYFQCTKCVEILLERGAKTSKTFNTTIPVLLKGTGKTEIVEGWTPLKFAVADGQNRAVKLLLEKGRYRLEDLDEADTVADSLPLSGAKTEIVALLSAKFMEDPSKMERDDPIAQLQMNNQQK